MDFLDLVKERFSVRSYSDKVVEDEKIAKILDAAKHAPTAVNYQPQQIYVLKSEEAIQKINSVCKCIFGAKTVFLICYDENRAWRNKYIPGYNSGEIDASIVCDHMMLEAWNLGIGSCWVGMFDPVKVSEVFNLPENIKPVALLPIGYAAPDCKPLEKMHNVFRPMEEMVTEL